MIHTSWTPELVAALAEPFPREVHTQKHNKGTFVSVHHYVARLNELVGPQGWSMDAPVAFHAGQKLCLGVGVTVLGVTKWNVGDEQEDHGDPIEYTDDAGNVKEKVVDFGSSSVNSWAQAFKRCCAYGFGLGLYLYDKEGTRQYLGNSSPQPQPSAAPQAGTPACPECKGAMWDNRENKRNPKAPDFKCKNKECDGAIWPPKMATPEQIRTIGEMVTSVQIKSDDALKIGTKLEENSFTADEAEKTIAFLANRPALAGV